MRPLVALACLLLAAVVGLPSPAADDDVPPPPLDSREVDEPEPPSWERITLTPQFLFGPGPCLPSQIPESNKTSCTFSLQGRVEALLRPVGRLVLRIGGGGGVGITTDVLLNLQTPDGEQAPVPLKRAVGGLDVGAGVALPLPGGELRVGGGFQLRGRRSDEFDLLRIERDYGLALNVVGRSSIAGRF